MDQIFPLFCWFSFISIFIRFNNIFSGLDPVVQNFTQFSAVVWQTHFVGGYFSVCMIISSNISYLPFQFPRTESAGTAWNICMLLEILENCFQVDYLICKYFTKNLAYLSYSKILFKCIKLLSFASFTTSK